MTLRIDLVFPRFKLLSGAERAILGLAGALAVDGHQVRIVCHQFDSSCRPRLPSGVDLVCSHARLDWSANRYLNAVADYVRCFALKPLLDIGADVCVLFGPSLPLVWAFRKTQRSHPLVFYYCWEPPRALHQDREVVLARVGWLRALLGPLLRAYSVVDRKQVSLADRVCTSSPFAVSQIRAVYGRSASVITPGVDRARLDAARSSARRNPPVVLTVNYLHPRKRVELFIEAASVCRELWADATRRPRWLVVGDGPERDRLERLAGTLGVAGDVEFAGFVPDNELPEYYTAASCYVHTGVEESFGLSVIEASYCGCPIVAVDEGGVRKTVEDGVTGHLVPALSSELATSVATVLNLDDQGQAMGRAGHERVSMLYRWEQGAADIVHLVETLNV